MSWTLGYQHGLSAQAAERFCRSEDQQWVGIDCIAGNVIAEVGCEEHFLASDINRKETEACGENLIKLLGVLLRIEDRDSGSLRSPIRMIFGQKERSGDRCARRQSGAAN